MSIELRLDFDEAQIAKLMQIPLLLRLAPAERILKAMANPIVSKAKAIAPDSRKSGTRKKMSKKSSAKWPESGRNHIGFVYRKSDRGGYLVIGGKSPQANSFNFQSSNKAGVRVLWDRTKTRTMTRARVEPSQRFMQRALDETRSAQITAGNAQLEKECRELKIG